MKTAMKLIFVLGILCGFAAAPASAGPGAWLGVYTETVDDVLAEDMELGVDYGVLISEVVDDSPADEAGLKDDDVIIAIDGEPLKSSRSLVRTIRKHEPGDEIKLTVIRRGKKSDIEVTLGKQKSRSLSRTFSIMPGGEHDYSFSWHDDDSERAYLGISMSGLSDQLGTYFGVEDGEGALVTEVHEDSPAEKAGLKAGDVVIAVDDEEIEDPGDVSEAIHEKEVGDKTTITVIRDKSRKTIEVELAEAEDKLGGYYMFGDDDGHDVFFRKFVGGDDDHFDIALDKYSDVWTHFKGKPGEKEIQLMLESDDDVGEEMDELRQELKELKEELKELKKQLE